MLAGHKNIAHLLDLDQYFIFLMFTIIKGLLEAILQGLSQVILFCKNLEKENFLLILLLQAFKFFLLL
jgi:hypothetical protein